MHQVQDRSRRRRSGTFTRRAPLIVLAALLALPSAASAAPYIVTVVDGVEPLDVARAQSLRPTFRYDTAMNGFAADLSSRQVTNLARDPRVADVTGDQALAVTAPKASPTPAPTQVAQFTSFGQDRMGLLRSRTAAVDEKGGAVDADIAVLDTGVNAHFDLDVVGGVSCVPGTSGYVDRNGHGTQVAGFAAARDNPWGQVGVAPGARVHAVRVATDQGIVMTSSAICGLEWVRDNAAVLEVANLSFGAKGRDTGNCGAKTSVSRKDPLHAAVCSVTSAGVVIVAAAGNDGADASGQVPAAYPEAIAVSAFTETDGIAGGFGPVAGCLPSERDDHLATFSNFGAVIDLAAPGVCVASTADGITYVRLLGTSFAAPHVAGAAALVTAVNPTFTPSQVHAALLAAAERSPLGGDPDGIAEPIVNVASL